jgi:hypothetical protein
MLTQSGNEAGVSTLYVPYVSPALSYVPYVSPTVQLLLLSLPRQGAATSLFCGVCVRFVYLGTLLDPGYCLLYPHQVVSVVNA